MKKAPGPRGGTPSEQPVFAHIDRIAAERNIDRLLLLLADFGRDLIGADRCTVWLLDEKDGTLSPRITIPGTSGIAGWVATRGEALLINDPDHDERFDTAADELTGYRTRSILALPIKDADGRTVGVIQAVNKTTGAGTFSKADSEHLQLAAAYTGEVLTKALKEEEVEATQREIILTMAEAGEARSKGTGLRTRRISEYCQLLSQQYGLSESDADVVKLSSPMYDIGKIAIPDSILLKPSKLDEAEWAVMKTHPTLGHDMLKHSERGLLHAAAIIAWQHHERWDGTGYPCGLAGDAIHIFARITALADVFDALASDRPWRKAWQMDRVVKLIEEERGKHFDPVLAGILLGNVDAFVAIRNARRDEADGPAAPPEPSGKR